MEPLSDPCGDRKVKTVKPPPHREISAKLLWPDPKNPSNL